MNVPKARKLPSGNWFIQLRLGGESISITAATEMAGMSRQTIRIRERIFLFIIGTPFYAEADYVHEIRHLVDGKWRADRAPLHYCSHSLGPVLMWMDDYIVRCTASGNRSTMLEPATDGNIDLQVALFETAKGATIKLCRSSVALRHPALCTYSIIGTKGFLEGSRTSYEEVGPDGGNAHR